MFRTVVIFAAIVGYVMAQNSEVCNGYLANRNSKDLYPDSADCHAYYQCFYINETLAVGIHRQCPAGSFWHDEVLSCMPEGDTPCVDRCMEDATAAHGCYAGLQCNSYFVCSNTGSFGQCCPEGTEFVEATCSCETSETCTDVCVAPAPAVATTVAPAEQINATVCEDSFGSLVASDVEPNAFHLVDEEGHSTGKQYCVDGSAFNIVTCRCDIEIETPPRDTEIKRQASLFVDFDGDASDNGINKYYTVLTNGAAQDASDSAHGSGSLATNGGSLVVPAFKNWDGRDAASWSFFYKCAGSCSGGILSLNDQKRTLSIGFQSSSSLTAYVGLWQPAGPQTLTAAVSGSAWKHVAVTLGDNTLTLYIDGQVADQKNVAGLLTLAETALSVGYDKDLGAFSGYVDELVVTPFALHQSEIDALRSGDYGYLADLGFF